MFAKCLASRAATSRLFSMTARRQADPWPLPHTPEHLASTTTPADLPAPTPMPRLNESIDTLRARLVYQSRKRGTLESDLLLSTFARDHLAAMTEVELKEYDKILDEPDWDIYYWATENRSPPERWANSAILEKLKVHARNEAARFRYITTWCVVRSESYQESAGRLEDMADEVMKVLERGAWTSQSR